MESGGWGPCLDLRRLAGKLAHAARAADLVVLEGMGRALHTNLHAQLSVDCLKAAVVKNPWVAERLGGQTWDVVFKFEEAGGGGKVSSREDSP